jgi:hypothetical protein
MLLASIRKYIFVATAISITANAALWYGWKGAVADGERAVAEAAAAEVEAANYRWGVVADSARAAHEKRVAELEGRLAQSHQVTADSVTRAEEAEGKLKDYIAATEDDQSEEYLQWASTKLPPQVTNRIAELSQ